MTATVAALVVSCSAPVQTVPPIAHDQPTPTASPLPPASASVDPRKTDASVQPTAAPSPIPSARALPSPSASAPAAGPSSAGALPQVGALFFLDYDGPTVGRTDNGRTFPAGLFRYDGATGSITKVAWHAFVAGGPTHETPGGVYLQGLQGRWDLLRWDGTLASDREFTACQDDPGTFASWCAVSATGLGVGYGSHVALRCPSRTFIRTPGAPQARVLLPEFCILWVNVSIDGTQLLIGRLAADPAVVADASGSCKSGYVVSSDGICYRLELWTMPVGGTALQLRLSPDLPGVGTFALSPDGRYATAQSLGGLFRIDLSDGRATFLGSVFSGGSARWSANGRLAFVRGGLQESWLDKTIVVVAPDGSMRDVRGYKGDGGATFPSGLAPAWDPTGTRLAWISSPQYAVSGKEGTAQDYLDGRDVGDRRVLVSDLTSEPLEVRCGEGVAEGVRWSHDGTALLLLCRRPGARVNAFELWMYQFGAQGGAVPIVKGLTLGGVDPNGLAPSLLSHTAWSRGLPIGR